MPPNAMSRGNIPPVHPLVLLLLVTAKGNMFCKCKRRSKCCMPEWGLQQGFNASWGQAGCQGCPSCAWEPGGGSRPEPEPLAASLWQPTGTNPRSSAVERGHRAGITGIFLTSPVYPAGWGIGEPRGWPGTMLWGCSWGPFAFAAAIPKVRPSSRGPGDKGSSFPRGEAAPALSWLAPRNSGGDMGDSKAAVPEDGHPFPCSLRPQKPERQLLPLWGLQIVLGLMQIQATNWPRWGWEATRAL